MTYSRHVHLCYSNCEMKACMTAELRLYRSASITRMVMARFEVYTTIVNKLPPARISKTGESVNVCSQGRIKASALRGHILSSHT